MYEQPFSFGYNAYESRPFHQVLGEISKAVNDEFQAIHYYTRLAELAPNNQFRQMILGIRQDEIKHFHWFSRAYHELTSKYPPITLGVQLPGSFKRGVRDSIKDEQETVPFYHKIASQVQNQRISQRFLRAAADEQRHAQIFSQMATY